MSDTQWAKITPPLPDKASDPGRTGADNRVFVNGCLWVLRSGAHWCDLTERYGRWKSVHKHFRRFATRYDRRMFHFIGFIHLTAAMIWLR